MKSLLRPWAALIVSLGLAVSQMGHADVASADSASADVAGANVSSAGALGSSSTSSIIQPGPTAAMPTADRVVVHKGDRKMLLMHGDSILRSYKISLGLNPLGHKERAGDFRTPEGRYRLTRRNPRSDFFLSIQVSYPNDTDVKNARRNGWESGGSIMIHGLPNQLKHTPTYYTSSDWTDGCIAVTNSDMLEIWLLTVDNAPIEILP
jgi:murein L,D-transpeptidase YafK